jgi:hypothetical protein
VGLEPGAVGSTLPVHETPLSAKLAGTGFAAPVSEPPKPNEAEPPVPMAPFQPVFATVTSAPAWFTVPFHSWVTFCPAVNDQVNCQPVRGTPRLVTSTFATKPPVHWLCTV